MLFFLVYEYLVVPLDDEVILSYIIIQDNRYWYLSIESNVDSF